VDEIGTGRLEMFSDGVFAIAATLLVLEFSVTKGGHPPPPPLGHQLLHLWPSYLAYTTSFLTIGIIWINHHHVMETIARVDRTYLFVNTLLLLVVAFIPFPTKLVADYLESPDERAAVYTYGLTLLLMAVVFNVLWTYARWNRRLLLEDFPQSKVRAVTQAAFIGVPMTALVLVLATWTPLGAILFALAISAFYLPGVMLFDRVTE
jgi:uncharacterized membrane protein